MRVLLIDDATTMQKIQANQLRSIGITDLLFASNGADGLIKLAESMPVDVVLLDVNMPVMDGMTVLRQIRADSHYASVKIIMVTSETEKSKVLEAIRAGANDYLVKPFTAEAFRERMTDLDAQ